MGLPGLVCQLSPPMNIFLQKEAFLSLGARSHVHRSGGPAFTHPGSLGTSAGEPLATISWFCGSIALSDCDLLNYD